MGFDFSYLKEGGAVTGFSLLVWILALIGGASQTNQVLTVVATGVMGVITMLVKHLLEKSGRNDRKELRDLRVENREQTRILREQAAQIDALSRRVAAVEPQKGSGVGFAGKMQGSDRQNAWKGP
jgi:hypothetical protein